jgi:hypothetical protein
MGLSARERVEISRNKLNNELTRSRTDQLKYARI